jgi:antitoxin ParD1/3/4
MGVIERKVFPMAASQKRTISLPDEQASYIDGLVKSGSYASASEVVRAGLRALRERDDAVERWLREEVVPVAAGVQADPSRLMPANAAFDGVRSLHAERRKGRKA